jgi:hypothetical protein
MKRSDFLNVFNEKALRPLLAAGKKKIDEALESAQTEQLTDALEDAFEQIKNGSDLSAQIDPAKIEQAIDAVKAQLQKPTVALVLAHGIKQLAKRSSPESLEAAIAAAMPNGGFEAQLVAQLILSQLENVKNTNANDLATQISKIAASLPSDLLAQQLGAQLQAAAQKQTQQVPGLDQLPDAQVIADATKDVIKALSDTLDNASKTGSFADTVNVLKQFGANADAILKRALGQDFGQDNQPPSADDITPKPPRKKGPGKKWDL